MGLFNGMKLDKTNSEYMIEEIISGNPFKGTANPVYHKLWKRPFLAIGVLFGYGMVIHIVTIKEATND